MEKKIRINKYLSLCGLGSRRSVEPLITNGRVGVNGAVTRDLARMVDPDADSVTCDHAPVKPVGKPFYVILNKPRGYVTTLSDEHGRPIVMDLIPEKYRRVGVTPVGRLDMDTEGLLFLTNDGELAHRLTNPRFHVSKEYHAELDHPLGDLDRSRLEKGVYLNGVRTRAATIENLNDRGTMVRIIITEGKKRQIRIIFKNFGYTVTRLKRVAFGTLTLSRLPRGSHRVLRPVEIKRLKDLSAGKIS